MKLQCLYAMNRYNLSVPPPMKSNLDDRYGNTIQHSEQTEQPASREKDAEGGDACGGASWAMDREIGEQFVLELKSQASFQETPWLQF